MTPFAAVVFSSILRRRAWQQVERDVVRDRWKVTPIGCRKAVVVSDSDAEQMIDLWHDDRRYHKRTALSIQ